jgi:hypothetical protein
MTKYTAQEQSLIKSIVAMLSIKKVHDEDIIKEVYEQIHKTIARKTLYNVRQQIKKDSFKWYKTMREGEYEYIHEFKERIDEILWLQRKHHEIIDSKEATTIKQSSLAELHRLNITLSNYFDVAPTIIHDSTISAAPQSKATVPEIIV